MSRRVLIRAVSFLVFAFLLLAAIAVENMQKARQYEQVITDVYGYAFAELVADVTKIDYALQKSIYATTSPMLTSLCAEIYRESASSMTALSQLPVSELSLENTVKFLSRTGDYAYYISKKASRGEEISGEEREALSNMADSATAITRMLQDLSQQIEKDPMDISSVRLNESTDAGGVRDDIIELEREFSEYPVLIYDGPFSDHIKDRDPAFTAGKAEIDEGEAKKRAAKFIGCDESSLVSNGARFDGKIEIYSFVVDVEQYSVYIDVVKKGGHILRVISSRESPKRQLTEDDALAMAKEILAENGFTDMRETYHMEYGNNLTINFAYYENNTAVYTDLVKLTVSLEDGSVINFDSTGYIMNHRRREVADIGKNAERAKAVVSPELRIIAYSPAIIPTDGKGEVLTHEFKCENSKGQHCIVYVNAETENEEKILILLEDEKGTLVM